MSNGFEPNLLDPSVGQNARYAIEAKKRTDEQAAKFRHDVQALLLKARSDAEKQDIGARGKMMLDQVANAEAAAQQEALQAQGEGVSKVLRENVKAQTGVDTNVKFGQPSTGIGVSGTDLDTGGGESGGEPEVIIGDLPVDAAVPQQVIDSYLGAGIKGIETREQAEAAARTYGQTRTTSRMVPITANSDVNLLFGLAGMMGFGPGGWTTKTSEPSVHYPTAAQVEGLMTEQEIREQNLEAAGLETRQAERTEAIELELGHDYFVEQTKLANSQRTALHDQKIAESKATMSAAELRKQETQLRIQGVEVDQNRQRAQLIATLSPEDQATHKEWQAENPDASHVKRYAHLLQYESYRDQQETLRQTANEKRRIEAKQVDLAGREVDAQAVFESMGIRSTGTPISEIVANGSTLAASVGGADDGRHTVNSYYATFIGDLTFFGQGKTPWTGTVPMAAGVSPRGVADAGGFLGGEEIAYEQLDMIQVNDALGMIYHTPVDIEGNNLEGPLTALLRDIGRAEIWNMTRFSIPDGENGGWPTTKQMDDALDLYADKHGESARATVRNALTIGESYRKAISNPAVSERWGLPHNPKSQRHWTTERIEQSRMRLAELEARRDAEKAARPYLDPDSQYPDEVIAAETVKAIRSGVSAVGEAQTEVSKKLLEAQTAPRSSTPTPPPRELTPRELQRKRWNRPAGAPRTPATLPPTSRATPKRAAKRQTAAVRRPNAYEPNLLNT